MAPSWLRVERERAEGGRVGDLGRDQVVEDVLEDVIMVWNQDGIPGRSTRVRDGFLVKNVARRSSRAGT